MSEEIISNEPVAVETVDTGAIDDGSAELAIIEQAMSGQAPMVPQPTVETVDAEAEQPKIDELELLKKYGLPGNSLEEFAGRHKELENNYASRLQPLNWAAKNAPKLLGDFYQKLNTEIMKAQGLPVPEEKTSVSPEGAARDVLDEMVGQINPATGEPYTKEHVDGMVRMVEAAVLRSGKFLPKQDYEGEKAAQEATRNAEDAHKAAVKTYSDFKDAWEPKFKEMGLDFAAVEKGMDAELAIFGIGKGNDDKVTPDILGRALNGYLMQIPGGLETLMKNYAANAQKNNDLKKGKAAVIAKGGVRGEAEAPEKIDALLNKGDFKGAEAILARQLAQYKASQGLT